ncbi:hypothetical protein IFM51744_10562 [Aspergillus udagawae]|nr:hypothetical protein IFM51744_10562 [Aspergillus udagawae]GFG17364.1 hypothetical protein IFM5058_08435 [Aspergillus udagawae]
MSKRNRDFNHDKELVSSKKKKNAECTSHLTQLTHDDYTVGWVCALPKEQTAATATLDHIHANLPKPSNDHNTYTLGSIGGLNIVIACLPKGKYGTNSASIVATRMVSTFPSIKFGLLVGIGGGIPPKVRLGDVVVSTPTDEFPGVVQWDMGKAEEGGNFKRTGALNNPPSVLLTALAKLVTKHEMSGSKIHQYLDDMGKRWPKLVPKYTRYDFLKDPLFSSDSSFNRPNQPRELHVHYGLIASGNQVIEDAKFRDSLNEALGGNVLCVEMEAAGLMNDFPCVVIRGICDYADSQKNKDSQEYAWYAAAIAAAYARELLEALSVPEADARHTCKPNPPNEESQDALKIERENFDVELVPFFTGRSVEVNQIRQLFQPSRSRTTVVLYDLGGIGKTQVALKYAYDFKDEYSAIFWVNYRSADTVKQSLFAAAERVHWRNPSWPGLKEVLESNDINKASLAVIDWLSQDQNNRWLVICDGYDQCQTDDSKQENWDLHRMIRAHHGHILITSRWRQSDLWHHVQIEKFTDLSQGVDLLLKRSDRPSLRDDPDIQRLAQTLDGLPLALVTAGAYLGICLYSCSKYLSVYNQSWLRLLKETPTSDAYDRTLYSTWNLTWARICTVNKLAANLLQFCAYFDNKGLWFELFQMGDGLDKPRWLQSLTENEFGFEVAVRTLREHALVEEQPDVRHDTSGSIRFSIHNCVHSWTIHVLNENWNYEMSSSALGCIASRIPRESTPSFWHISQNLLGHANRIVDLFSRKRLIQGYTEAQVEQMQDIIWFFLARGRPETVEKMCISLHEQVEEMFGYYHPATFTLKWLMISIFTSLKNYGEAESMCNRILRPFAVDPGIDEGRAKRSFTLLLARNCILRGQTKKGMELLSEPSTSSQDEGISSLLFEKNLVSLLWTQYPVQDMPRDMQTWMENHLPKEETGKVKSCQQSFDLLCTQIHLCLSQNENEEAKDLLVEAREMFDKENSADYAKPFMFSRLAALYIKLDKYGDLKSLCDNATTEDWESLWQSDVQLSCSVVLMRCYVHLGDHELDETVALCQRALNKLQNSRAPGSAQRQSVLIMLGSVYMLKENLLEAEKQFAAAIQETRESKQQCTSSSYENALTTITALAERYKDRGEQDSAQRCLKLVEKCQGELLRARHGGLNGQNSQNENLQALPSTTPPLLRLYTPRTPAAPAASPR